MTDCDFICEKEAVTKLRYTEPGTQVSTKNACRRHANVEQIHDPINVEEVSL